jgi:hypothetical protein
MITTRKKVFMVIGLAVVFAAFCGVYVWRSVPVMQFRPVRMDAQQKLSASSETLTSEQADHVVAVLQQYGQTFRRAGAQTVLITPALSMDTELVWNYTSKAGL